MSASVSVSLLVAAFGFVVSSLGFVFSSGFGFAAGFGFWFLFQLRFWLRCWLRRLVSVGVPVLASLLVSAFGFGS